MLLDSDLEDGDIALVMRVTFEGFKIRPIGGAALPILGGGSKELSLFYRAGQITSIRVVYFGVSYHPRACSSVSNY